MLSIHKRLLSALLFFAISHSCLSQDHAFIHVLGVVQDAGYPQSGCYQPHCMPGWEDPNLRRGATSIAVVDPAAKENFLFEATPNMPEQLYQLRNQTAAGSHALSGVFLTHAHIGHYAGLMFFGHEAQGANRIPVYAMPRMLDFLVNNGPWSQLVSLENIVLNPLVDQTAVTFTNVQVTPFLVPHRDEYSETVGYKISGPNKTAIFIPDINKWSVWDEDIAELVKSVDYALLDATFYADGELGNRDMSKIPHPFVSESMAAFDHLSAKDKNKVWFIHMNHTNPLLNSGSGESNVVRGKGYNIATEGTRLPL